MLDSFYHVTRTAEKWLTTALFHTEKRPLKNIRLENSPIKFCNLSNKTEIEHMHLKQNSCSITKHKMTIINKLLQKTNVQC